MFHSVLDLCMWHKLVRSAAPLIDLQRKVQYEHFIFINSRKEIFFSIVNFSRFIYYIKRNIFDITRG